ncbi:unnamed protein product [Pleuronectes platessa]|uniref:Uncharacterized protein n=1 Tax=Pleuronectes platessa TaxID=8262 RepID=A0A9N7TSV5_PLEPL|nr:unnamed protein product [Pleuronectes platessa]
MEEELAKHLKQLADQFHGLAPVKCRELAFEYAEKNNIPVPANWTEKQCAAGFDCMAPKTPPQVLRVSRCTPAPACLPRPGLCWCGMRVLSQLNPAAAGAPGDERGGLDNDERVEAHMVDHLTCESLRSCFPDTGRANRGVTLGLPFWTGLQLQI